MLESLRQARWSMLPDDAEIEMETLPETAMFRKTMLMRWQMLSHALTERGAQLDPGEVRAHISVLVTHAPVAAVARFVDASEAWLTCAPGHVGRNEEVVDLILCAYPRPTWAKTPALTKEVAADDQAWLAWIRAWKAEFSSLRPGAKSASGTVGGRLAKFLHIEGESAMLDAKNLLSSALKLGQVALQIYLGAEENRQRRIAEGEAATSPMTLESVMREAQCHIPGLETALAAVMGDEQQARECIDAITRTPDLLGVLKTLSGFAPVMGRTPGPTPAAPPGAPARRQELAMDAGVDRRPGPPAFRPEFGPRKPGGTPAGAPATAANGSERSPQPPAAPPTSAPEGPAPSQAAAAPPTSAQEAIAPPRAAAPPPASPQEPPAQSSLPDPPAGVELELAALESWVSERSGQVRQRGERLAERLGAFVAQGGLSIHGTPAPAFVDPPDTAEAQAAATRIQPTHFDGDGDQAIDLHVKTLIDRTKQRLERRYDLDDQFLAWLEEQFEAVQAATKSRSRTIDAASAA